VEEMAAGKYFSLMAGQMLQQAELGCSGNDGVSANGDDHGIGINLDGACRDLRFVQRLLKAAQNGFYPGHQFARAEWLRNVVIGAQLKTVDAVRFRALRRQKNNRSCRESAGLPDLPTQLHTISSGHHDVEEEKDWLFFLGVAQNACYAREDACDKTSGFKVMAHQPRNINVVFDDKNSLFHRVLRPPPRASGKGYTGMVKKTLKEDCWMGNKSMAGW